MGRPTVRTEENAETICNRLIQGESLVEITNDPAMPGYTTILGWLQEDTGFRGKYAQARAIQAERMASEILTIADDGSNDTYVDEEGNKKVDYDNIARSRLRVDTRKWIASKLLPKVYGDKTAEVNNSVVVNNITIMSEEKRKEIQARCREALAPPDAQSVSTLTS